MEEAHKKQVEALQEEIVRLREQGSAAEVYEPESPSLVEPSDEDEVPYRPTTPPTEHNAYDSWGSFGIKPQSPTGVQPPPPIMVPSSSGVVDWAALANLHEVVNPKKAPTTPMVSFDDDDD